MAEEHGHRNSAAIIELDDLEHSRHSHEFVGAEHGDVPFSITLVHSEPGVGPKLHRHPYAEVFVVESGQATFQLGEESFVVDGGHVVVGPPDVPHGFTNTGTVELRLTAIHGAGRIAGGCGTGRQPPGQVIEEMGQGVPIILARLQPQRRLAVGQRRVEPPQADLRMAPGDQQVDIVRVEAASRRPHGQRIVPMGREDGDAVE